MHSRAYLAANPMSFEDIEEECLSFNIGELSHISLESAHSNTACSAASGNRNPSGLEAQDLSLKYTEDKRAAHLNTSTNNSTGTKQGRSTAGGCSGHGPTSLRGYNNLSAGQRPAGAGAGTKKDESAALMNCCVQNTVDQAKQMHVKGAECQREDPYAALRTETFKKLLKTTGRRPALSGRTKRRRAGSSGKKKIKFCKTKTDECEVTQLQLCPMLGVGHTHQKVIAEVTPMLLRTARSLDCQLREICRRLFFMKHNMPQMTAPALVNFHAILTEVTRMLIADFATFPTELKLPGCSKTE